MAILLDAIALPSDLLWADEFDWSPVESSQEYAVDGALVVDTAVRQAGRPITLQGATDRAWIDRATLQSVYALLQPADRVMTLALNGTDYDVIWRPGQEPISAEPIFPLANPQNDLAYVVTLRFTEV